ncbi:MAG TPA: hypothetical protein QF716_04705, partial [Candidatus Thalassarchaeaceae archaeon]|nr:hypothetical protein [Candidatus Thalassarchaeaceae archaeon]
CPDIPGALLGVPGPGCPMPVGDEDGDNIPDEEDLCPDTPEGESANIDGCSPSQIDTDGDSVTDDADICPNTPLGEIVNSVGCSSTQTNIDTDGDGVNDVDENADQLDMCPNTIPADYDEVDANGCAPSQLDTDEDGVTDDLDLCPGTTLGATVTADGCIVVGADTDSDGIEDAVDDFPADETQWTDSDDDGFGDNWADSSWNESREGTVGQWVANATSPDSCPRDYGVSNNSAGASPGTEVVLGCPDIDSDGWADSIDWDNLDSSQWEDLDNDGFGDNSSGINGDQCVGQPGIADADGEGGVHENGCPTPDEDNDGVLNHLDQCQGTPENEERNSDGCADSQLDTDEDGVSDADDVCADTDWRESDLVDETGCTPAQLQEAEDSESSFMDGPMKFGVIAIGAILAIVILMMVISRIRGNRIDWDEEDDDDDDYHDDDDDDDWDPFSTSSGTAPMRSFSSEPSREPSSRGPPTRSQAPPTRSSRGPPTRSESPPTRSQPPSSAPSRQARPSARPSAPTREVSQEPTEPVRKTRRTSTTTPATDDHPVRKTRKTSRSPATAAAAPTRKTRRTATPAKQSRRRKSSGSFDDLFGPDEKADFDASVAAAKERLIVGDSEQSVLARLQSEGWNVKQSKHILGHARP